MNFSFRDLRYVPCQTRSQSARPSGRCGTSPPDTVDGSEFEPRCPVLGAPPFNHFNRRFLVNVLTMFGQCALMSIR